MRNFEQYPQCVIDHRGVRGIRPHPSVGLGRSARATEIDASYGAYDEHPLDEPDEWGDLASFREAAARS